MYSHSLFQISPNSCHIRASILTQFFQCVDVALGDMDHRWSWQWRENGWTRRPRRAFPSQTVLCGFYPCQAAAETSPRAQSHPMGAGSCTCTSCSSSLPISADNMIPGQGRMHTAQMALGAAKWEYSVSTDVRPPPATSLLRRWKQTAPRAWRLIIWSHLVLLSAAQPWHKGHLPNFRFLMQNMKLHEALIM